MRNKQAADLLLAALSFVASTLLLIFVGGVKWYIAVPCMMLGLAITVFAGMRMVQLEAKLLANKRDEPLLRAIHEQNVNTPIILRNDAIAPAGLSDGEREALEVAESTPAWDLKQATLNELCAALRRLASGPAAKSQGVEVTGKMFHAARVLASARLGDIYLSGKQPTDEERTAIWDEAAAHLTAALAHELDMHDAGEVELARILRPEIVAKIRTKQAAKARDIPFSSLPTATQQTGAVACWRYRFDPSMDRVGGDVSSWNDAINPVPTGLIDGVTVEYAYTSPGARVDGEMFHAARVLASTRLGDIYLAGKQPTDDERTAIWDEAAAHINAALAHKAGGE